MMSAPGSKTSQVLAKMRQTMGEPVLDWGSTVSQDPRLVKRRLIDAQNRLKNRGGNLFDADYFNRQNTSIGPSGQADITRRIMKGGI